MGLDPLSRLAIRHGTDKYGEHLYTPIYHRVFAHLRKRKLRVLEIGVGWPPVSVLGGASLRMWRDYFPRAHIVGLDVEPKRLDLGPRVTVVRGSQDDPEFLGSLAARHGPFDIVIDDGSHRASHVLTAFRTLYPLMPEGGLYAVEDVQTAFWQHYGGEREGRGTIVERLHRTVLAMHAREVRADGETPGEEEFGEITASVRAWRNLVVFERGRNDYPSNRVFTATHDQVRGVLRAFDAVRAEEWTEGEVVSRVGLLRAARDPLGALAYLRDALEHFPRSVTLLCLAQDLTAFLGMREESLTYAERFLALVPDEPAMIGMRRRLRGEAAA